MNTSKVLFVGGFCIALGLFSSGIIEADARVADVGVRNANRTTAEEVAHAGVNYAIYYLSTPSETDGLAKTGRKILGGSMSYVITVDPLDATKRIVASSGTVGTQKVVITATMVEGVSGKGSRKNWNKWNIDNMHVDYFGS